MCVGDIMVVEVVMEGLFVLFCLVFATRVFWHVKKFKLLVLVKIGQWNCKVEHQQNSATGEPAALQSK